MKQHLTEFDETIEAYLGRLANEGVKTQTRQAPDVRINHRSPATGLLLPAGQAALTGLFLGAAVGAVAILAAWPKPWAWALLTWLLVQALAWLFLLKDWQKILHKLEEATGRDLDNDLVIGSPVNSTMRVELVEDNGHKGTFYDLPGTPAQLSELARGVLNGVPLSRNSWTGEGAPFIRKEFIKLQNELITRKLAYWINPQATARGCRLTKPGIAIFKRLAEFTPTQQGEDDQERL